MKPTVYLAGPIAGLDYQETVDWREHATGLLKQFKIKTLSPMRGKGALAHEMGKVQGSYEHDPLSSRSGITTRDRFDVMRCDMVLANFNGAQYISIGTCIEIGWADAWRKPLVVIMDVQNVHWHAMVRQIAGFVVSDMEEAIEVVKAVLLS